MSDIGTKNSELLNKIKELKINLPEAKPPVVLMLHKNCW